MDFAHCAAWRMVMRAYLVRKEPFSLLSTPLVLLVEKAGT